MGVVVITQWKVNQLGWLGWLPFYGAAVKFELATAKALLATILANPPIPVFKEIVCSPFASQLAVAAGKADLNADGLVNGLDTRLTWGETPGDLLSLPGTTVNVIE